MDALGFVSTEGKGDIPSSCILKFFPLAFWLVWNKSSTFLIDTEKIPVGAFKDLDDDYEIALDLRNIPPLDYPEEPNDSYVISLCHDRTFLATPKRQKPKGFG